MKEQLKNILLNYCEYPAKKANLFKQRHHFTVTLTPTCQSYKNFTTITYSCSKFKLEG
jgi:hypothetical protein